MKKLYYFYVSVSNSCGFGSTLTTSDTKEFPLSWFLKNHSRDVVIVNYFPISEREYIKTTEMLKARQVVDELER